MRAIVLCWWMVGCGGEATDTDPTEGDADTDSDADTDAGFCGDLDHMDVVVTGRVVDGDDLGIEGAEVILEERNWRPGMVYGTATTGVNGTLELHATGLEVYQDCWGSTVSYWLVGSDGTGLEGEKPMNSPFSDAYDAGSSTVDLGDFPLVLR